MHFVRLYCIILLHFPVQKDKIKI